jgi:beta-galactosidase
VHLDWVSPAKVGKIGYARTYLYSSRAREAVFAVSADYWAVFKVNGESYLDHSTTRRPARVPRPGEFRFVAPLEAGWNRLETKVASGSAGFGFWCMVSDPGDARVRASISPPADPPDDLPPEEELLPEPPLNPESPLYSRPLEPGEDPYAWDPW